MTDRERFLKALAKNEDDTSTRLVFADWLDEHGEYDEANRQRAWPEAKAWLVKFYSDSRRDQIETLNGYRREYPDEYEGRTSVEDDFDDPSDNYVNTFERMMEQATACILGSDRWGGSEPFGRMIVYNSEWLCDALRAHHREFWTNACIYLGYPIPDDLDDKGHFSCAC